MKWASWERGISPNEFEKMKMSDVETLFQLQSSNLQQDLRRIKINNMINSIK